MGTALQLKWEKPVRRKTIKRATGSSWVGGKNWRLADEVRTSSAVPLYTTSAL